MPMHDSGYGIEWFHDSIQNVDELVASVSSLPWSRPQNVDRKARSNSVFYMMSRDRHPVEFGFVEEFLSSGLAEYREKYRLPKLKYESVEALLYEEGERYVEHFDNGSPHVANRICSMVAYLNDDYEGGEIEFPIFGLKTKPKAGSLVVFPSNYPYLHVVHPVLFGKRYALNVFFCYE